MAIKPHEFLVHACFGDGQFSITHYTPQSVIERVGIRRSPGAHPGSAIYQPCELKLITQTSYTLVSLPTQ